MISPEHVLARRAALIAQMERKRLEYADLEEDIKQRQQELARRQRAIDVLHGGVLELELLLSQLEEDSPNA